MENTINNEYENLLLSSKQNISYFINLKRLFLDIQTQFENFYTGTRISVENFYTEQIKIESKMISARVSLDLYSHLDKYLINVKEVITKLEKDLIDPISLFQQQISQIYSEALNDLNKVAIIVTEHKKQIEKNRNKYYECCNSVIEKEELMKRYQKDKIIVEMEIEQLSEQILKSKSLCENHQEQYKYEIIKFNNIIQDQEEKYKSLLEILKSNEESRIFFIKSILEKFSKIYESFNIFGFDFVNQINNCISNIIVSEDIQMFNEKYKCFIINNHNRFTKEEFISYEKFKNERKNSDISNNNTNIVFNINNKPYKKNEYESFDLIPIKFNDDFEIVNSSDIPINELSESYFIGVIKKFLEILFSNNELQVENIGQIIHYINSDYSTESIESLSISNINFSKLLIDNILLYKSFSKDLLYLNIDNINNLKHFANILNTISINISEDSCFNFELNFPIIYIAGRIYSYNNNSSNEIIYLCSILSLNTLYSTKTFWMTLIDNKISKKIDDSLKKYNSHKKRESSILDCNYSTLSYNQYNTNTNTNSNFNSNSFISSQNNTGLIGSMGSKIKGLFNKGSKKPNYKNIPIEIIKEYDQTTQTREIIKEKENTQIENIKYQEASIVLKEFLIHFANFNIEISDAVNIIVEVSSKYNFPRERVSLYVTLLNSNYLTIKNTIPDKIKKQKSSSLIISKKNIGLYDDVYSNSLNMKCIILYNSSSFISKNELSNLFILNKDLSKILRNKIIGNFLINLSPKEVQVRINLWKLLLNVNNLKKEIKYRKELEFVNKNNLEDRSVIDIINLDVARTYFNFDAEISRICIGNILKTIAFIKPEINYCQGMNYIASFIYNITKNEEDTFYIMLGLFTETEYKIMFINDLSRLKQFFYIFDRLLSLKLPELNNFLKTLGIVSNYYCSSWFITLFTNSYHFKAFLDLPLILIKIWDDFILNGSEALVKAGLILLKMNEKQILKMKYEELLHYLINDLIKRTYYINENYDEYVKNSSIILKSGLLDNIENEIVQEKRLKEVDCLSVSL